MNKGPGNLFYREIPSKPMGNPEVNTGALIREGAESCTLFSCRMWLPGEWHCLSLLKQQHHRLKSLLVRTGDKSCCLGSCQCFWQLICCHLTGASLPMDLQLICSKPWCFSPFWSSEKAAGLWVLQRYFVNISIKCQSQINSSLVLLSNQKGNFPFVF